MMEAGAREEADSFAALRNDKQKDRHPGGNWKRVARPGKAGATDVTVVTSRPSSGRFKYKNGKPPSDRSGIDLGWTEQVLQWELSLMVCEDVCPTYTVDKEFLIQAADICEALTNLTYLIRMDSGEPGRVQSYVEMVEERTHALGSLLHAIAGEDGPQ
jgi:hypothetical protein